VSRTPIVYEIHCCTDAPAVMLQRPVDIAGRHIARSSSLDLLAAKRVSVKVEGRTPSAPAVGGESMLTGTEDSPCAIEARVC